MLESFFDAIQGHSPSQPVVVPDLSYWIGAHRPGMSFEDQLTLHRDLGVMPYYTYGMGLCYVTYPDVEIRREVTAGGNTVTWIHPAGTLRKETTKLPESHCDAVTKYPVQNRDDLALLVQMFRDAVVQSVPKDRIKERIDTVGEYGGYPICAVPRSPLPALLTDWAGVMNGLWLLMDEPNLCSEFFTIGNRLEQQALDFVCEIVPPFVHTCDNLTSDVYTSLFDQHLREHYTRRLDALHSAGIRCATHLDGTVAGLLPKLVEVGFDAIEALTPSPVGDISAAEMRDIAGNSVTLWGGLPGAMFAPPWTWEQMEKHVEEVMTAWRGTPYILGIADQLPPDGNIDFVRRIADMVR